MKVTKQSKCELKISNTQINNMSNWQISNTINTLTTVNNKFDILDKLNTMIKDGYNKRDIFIMDKSFSFTNNYTTYFNKSIKSEANNTVDISKLSNMGKMVTMTYNYDIIQINSLLSFYKVLNSIINANLKCRLKQQYLNKSYKVLFDKGLGQAYEKLYEGAVEQVKEIYGQYTMIDNNKQNILVEKVKEEYKKAVNKNISKFEKIGKESEQKFSYFFNNCSRPIIGIYNENNHSFEIINADHMYKNGEESPNQIRLKSVTKNSPVILALIVTGIMLSFVGYLAYRNHNVNAYVEKNNLKDVPQKISKVIKNVLINNDGSILNVEEPNSAFIPDKQILILTKDIYNRLDNITDNKKVHIELSININ